jgi:hypothetical protein
MIINVSVAKGNKVRIARPRHKVAKERQAGRSQKKEII